MADKISTSTIAKNRLVIRRQKRSMRVIGMLCKTGVEKATTVRPEHSLIHYLRKKPAPVEKAPNYDAGAD